MNDEDNVVQWLIEEFPSDIDTDVENSDNDELEFSNYTKYFS